MQPGVIEVWDWPNNLKLQEYHNSSLATCIDFSGQDLLMGEGQDQSIIPRISSLILTLSGVYSLSQVVAKYNCLI